MNKTKIEYLDYTYNPINIMQMDSLTAGMQRKERINDRTRG